MLSDTYKRERYPFVNDTQNMGVETLLLRAKSRGYTHCVGWVPVKVSSSMAVYEASLRRIDTVYGHFFYPHALDWFTKKPLRFFREAFGKADSLGMVFIPSIAGVADGGGVAWSGLHPALDAGRAAPDLILNSYKNPDEWKGDTSYSTPFADDGPDGFDAHFREYLQRIKREYDEFYYDAACRRDRVHPKTLPYIYLSYDENYAGARDPVTGGMLPLRDSAGSPCFFPPPYESVLYTHKVLLLGQGNPHDRRFCDSVAAENGGDYADAVRKLYAYSLWKRAKQIHDVFGPSTRMIICGMMFDPQFGGATPWQIYHENTDKNSTNRYEHVVLSPRGECGVLDLPGLDNARKEFVRRRVILAPWYYSTDKFEGADPPPLSCAGGAPFSRYYGHSLTYRYIKEKGFRFAPISTLEIPRGDSCFFASNFDALKNTMLGVINPAFKGFAVGFIAITFPCVFEDSCRLRCRCGELAANGYWHNTRNRYDPVQPKEYFTLEYMADFAEGKWPPLLVVKTAASARPHGKSVIRDTSATVAGALAKAEPGDTVEVYGFSTKASLRWGDSAARRGITVILKGN
ncbi:MAG: hypothetical protein JW699_02390 [Chitinispirillaceae bacterium]|nr:hypothetical protein [Chitinispirillaceae bacterium]